MMNLWSKGLLVNNKKEEQGPLYACYRLEILMEYDDYTVYAKTPLGSDMHTYIGESGDYGSTSPVSSSSELTKGVMPYSEVTEERVVVTNMGTYLRYYAGDLYE